MESVEFIRLTIFVKLLELMKLVEMVVLRELVLWFREANAIPIVLETSGCIVFSY